MEDKQLNFNQPLLSVRRGSSIGAPPEVNKRKFDNSYSSLPSLPFYKSDLKSGPVANPGVVPFQWERTPGKRKDEEQQKEVVMLLPLVPKLPPGRVTNHKQKSTDKILNESLGFSSECEGSECERSEKGKDDENVSSSEDENVVYEDACDTLSRTESSFVNCSVSGVSGVGGPNKEPFGSCSDFQTRDFMMGRFLPAAKAVASETPHFGSWKHSVPREKPQPLNKNMVVKQIPKRHDVFNTLSHNVHKELEKEEDKDDDSDESYDAENMPTKLCGLLPKFCIMNPIPGMKYQGQVISSVRSVRTRPAYGGNKNERSYNQGPQKRSTRKTSPNTVLSCTGNTPQKDGSPKSFFGKESRFRGLPGDLRDLRVSKIDNNGEEINSSVKTLYIDSEERLEYQDSNSSSSVSRGRNPSVDYSLQAIKLLCGVDENAVSQPKSYDSSQYDTVKDLQREQNMGLEVEIQKPRKPVIGEVTLKGGPLLALTPLMLKSPTESWLSRTLPSMSMKNQSSKSYVGNPKHERMLKTSNGLHMISHPPGELATISEN